MTNEKNSADQWFYVSNVDTIDSPALLIYLERVKENIRLLKGMVQHVGALRPHVKTHKMQEVCELMLNEGISKFKCATIAEAEMLARVKAPDVLLAYQPVGPKLQRLLKLVDAYPSTHFSCLIDNKESAAAIAKQSSAAGTVLDVYIDLNVGMNRTGIRPVDALPLVEFIGTLQGIKLVGLHAYDGHIRDTDLAVRQRRSDEGFKEVLALCAKAASIINSPLRIVVGGTPTFPTHAGRENVECSPGTFVFTDWGYKHIVPDEPFEYGALVISRVISIVDAYTICTDLGHKSVAAENPQPRVHFLNAPDAQPIGQSEEHLVLKVDDSSLFKPGDVLYGVPVHICPTVALYDRAFVVEGNQVTKNWKVVARDRSIGI
jgi:D-serine deaminase-like pyridoxal phosphate-dependent protein